MKLRIGLFISITALILAIVLPIAIPGPQGERGPQGIQGIQGIQGEAGIQGIQGEKGDNGTIGPQGEKGDKGDTGEPGSMQGSWVLAGTLSGPGTMVVNATPNSPVKIFWVATSTENDSVLIVQLSADSGVNAWREISFLPGETKKGIEITLVNPNELQTLIISAKTGDFSGLVTNVYRFAPVV